MRIRAVLLALTLVLAALLRPAPAPAFPAGVSAPQAERKASGIVLASDTGDPLAGAVVVVKGTSRYVSTDLDGRFSLPIPDGNAVLEITYFGYKTLTLPASEKMRIRLDPDIQEIDEVQVIAYGKQSKMSITGSISSINTKELLKSPSGSAANALAGAVTGISSVQVSGQPGAEDPRIYVRGTGSLTESASAPLILVDGVERSFFQMDPNEIESITVLKDAASTAVFGVRGANGVILVTTRRGEDGKARLSVDSSFGLTQALRKLSGVDSYHYALLYTEAQRNDNPSIKDNRLTFSPYITEIFRENSDPIMFPNVDWEDYLFKDFAWQTHHNLTLSGGTRDVKYFVSLGYLHQDGMLKHYYETYNSNFTYDRFNYRANVDARLTPTTTVSFNIGGRVGIQQEPQNYDMWQNIMWCVPFASPGFVDGKVIYNSRNRYIPLSELTSGLDLYYNWGYTRNTANVLNLDLALDQDLSVLTEGLSFKAKGAYNTNYTVGVSRQPNGVDSALTPIYLGSLTTPGLDLSNPMFDNTIVYRTDGVSGLHEPMSYGEWSGLGRDWYLEGSLNYARSFGQHDVTGLLLYNQSKTYYPAQYSDIPTGYVGYVGRMTWAFRKRYMLDLNAGYNGSENFAPGRRYGFFPSGSVGWILSEEKWMKRQQVIDFLKLRASYGVVGNDKYSGERFLYLDDSWDGNHSVYLYYGSYQFGMGDSWDMLWDAKENTIGNKVVTWEKCYKQNYGLDLKMFSYRLSFTADVFFEHRTDILSTRNTLPSITDIKLPLINLGVVDNHGYEFSLGWKDKIARTVDYYLTANMSFSRNQIRYMDEVPPNEPYMAQTGRSTGLNYGYIFDRFLSEEDFDADGKLKPSLPEMALGSPKPGDVLYKDLNQNGVIDGNDCTWFGYAARPEYVFGLVGGLNWKGFSFSMQWTGAMHASRLLSGEYRSAFGTNNARSLLQFLADGRYTPETAETARFPRLTFANKSYNELDSSLWMLDGSYLRLKTAELAYTVSGSRFLSKAGISSAKLYVNGYNLLTLFSELARIDIDPEGMTGGSGASAYSYPNNRIYNFGVNLSF